MKNYTTKVSQWAETYRSGTDGEIKAALKTFYNMKAWHELHIALWVWLAMDGEREKSEWFEVFSVPEVRSHCFACKMAETIDAKWTCNACPMGKGEDGLCANGLWEKWVDAPKIAEREKLAREIAVMKWEEKQ